MYNTIYRLCVDQKNLYAFLRIMGWANTNIIIMTTNSSTPVSPERQKEQLIMITQQQQNLRFSKWHNQVFWGVTLCSYQPSQELWYLNLQGQEIHEDEVTMILQNVRNYWPNNTVPQPERPESWIVQWHFTLCHYHTMWQCLASALLFN